MASSKEYLSFILDQLPYPEEVSYRAMMGEYVICYRGKTVGGIYDDRFLVKPVNSARAMMPDAAMELPYEGAKPMLLVDNVDDRQFLQKLLGAIYGELPEPKRKKKTGP
ncbi:MAG: competence protein TfoX [Oscillospiraceae bacterium]|nr:competence protein TfoX [Oscillospiraceae bacterium]